jgi:large subunit ribosomal protein L29
VLKEFDEANMLKAQELRNENTQELNTKLEQLRSEIFQLRSQKLDSKTQKTHMIGQKRKEIARILTVKRERELRGKNE